MNKKNHYAEDPKIDQERKNYSSPIPSREYLMQIMEEVGIPISFRKLIRLLNVTSDDEKPLKYRLRAMERDGQILKNRRKKYGLAQRMDLIKGRVTGHSEGFGYLEVSSQEDKLFIPPHEMQKVLHGDEVMAYVVGQINSKGRREVAIAEILKRNTQTIVGEIYRESGVTFLKPSSSRFTQDVIIPKATASLNHKTAEARITHQPTKNSPPIGEIIEIIETQNAAQLEIQMALRTFQIPSEFPKAVDDELANIPDRLVAHDKKGRKNLTKLPFITIDGDDSKDFDDAIYAEKTASGWLLHVAIADVAHYVKPNTALDNEAQKRGNSVYFPNYVVPMLPEKLSNNLCSLNPKQDRLAIVCSITLDAEGRQESYQFCKAVINSHARMTYRSVNKMIKNKSHKLWQCHEDGVSDNIRSLNQLYIKFKEIRKKRGAITIASNQISIQFDDEGQIEKIEPYKIRRSNKIIEECMLLANTCAAHYLATHGKEALYRVHSNPHPEKIKQLKTTLTYLGINTDHLDTAQPQDFQKVIQQTKNTPHANLVQISILRTFKQAVYSPENIGHFGLNFEQYVHFTSPIRRYPDLTIHRSIEYLINQSDEKDPLQNRPWLMTLGEHCSKTERRAEEAGREVDLSLKCEFASKHLGEIFKGSITGVMPFGIFVFLPDLGLDGLVHVSALKSDYYHYDEVQHQLVGERKGAQFSLGDVVKVKLDQVRIKERRIDFSIA